MRVDVNGKFIAELRKEKKLTQKKLGEILNVSEKAISKWETGVYSPDLTILNKLSVVFDISLEELLEGKRKEKVVLEHKDIIVKKYDKKTIILIITLIVINLFLLFIVIMNNKNDLEYVEFKDTNSVNYKVKANIFYNKKEAFYNISEFRYIDKSNGTAMELNTYYLKISVLLNDNVIVSNSKEYTQFIPLYLAIQSFNFNIKENKYIYDDKDTLKIEIEYKDMYEDMHYIKFQLK